MNQILIIVAIIGLLLFLRWLRKQPRNKQIQAILILAAGILVAMALTGRLHWLFALFAALFALFQKFAGILRFLPLFGRFFVNNQTHSSNTDDNFTQNTKMTTEEACRILGINENASKEEIIEAHRKLIQKIHPDRGGNDYLATKINQAKDFLLKK